MHALIPFPDISPEIFTFPIFGFQFSLRWYALAYITGIIIGWRVVMASVKRPQIWAGGVAPMMPRQVEDLLTWVILGVILGGRLGYVLFYQPGHYLSNPGQILYLWQGGMSFHGGLMGVVLACVLYSKRQGIVWLSVADVLCMVAPIGLFLGRIANFINAELWGRPTDLPWGVIFPGDAAQDCPGVVGLCARHPTQLYEAMLEGLILGGVLLYLGWRRNALHRPGIITGTFFAGYGLSRFLVEFVRQADRQFITDQNPMGYVFEAGGIGLSMGQLLSLPMIIFGLGMISYARWHRKIG